MNIITGDYDKKTRHMTFELPLLGDAQWVQGEMYFNTHYNRYEHTATDSDGTEYLIISQNIF